MRAAMRDTRFGCEGPLPSFTTAGRAGMVRRKSFVPTTSSAAANAQLNTAVAHGPESEVAAAPPNAPASDPKMA